MYIRIYDSHYVSQKREDSKWIGGDKTMDEMRLTLLKNSSRQQGEPLTCKRYILNWRHSCHLCVFLVLSLIPQFIIHLITLSVENKIIDCQQSQSKVCRVLCTLCNLMRVPTTTCCLPPLPKPPLMCAGSIFQTVNKFRTDLSYQSLRGCPHLNGRSGPQRVPWAAHLYHKNVGGSEIWSLWQ